MTGKERRAARRATRQDRRAARKAKRQARRAARREAVGSKIQEWRADAEEAVPEKAGQQAPIQIPGPGATGTGWAGTPAAPGTVAATTAGGWWMDPKILILGAAALFILMRPKKAS